MPKKNNILEKNPEPPKGHAPFSVETYKLVEAVRDGQGLVKSLTKL